ncbi:MAG: hypothetical protein ACE149_15430 [Armatimonadota bacterium]
MRSVFWIALACLAAGSLVGCAGRPPTGAKQAAALSGWLGKQQFSSWQTFRQAGAKPSLPASPDGFTLGSPNVFAAIGAEPDDLSSLDVFWADERTVRPIAKPLTVSVLARGKGISRQAAKQPVPLASFPEQRLSRVRHSSIIVSESKRDDLKVTIVDFAPMGKDSSFLCRWFIIENTGKRLRRVGLLLKTMVQGEPQRLDGRALRLGDKLAMVSDTDLDWREEGVRLAVGRIDPGERASAALLLVGARDGRRLEDGLKKARAATPLLMEKLEETRLDWERWCARSELKTGDERTDDLLDSLLCLVRGHIGSSAIHTGSLRYPHDRAWVRDSYWVQRALLELGYADEAKLNLRFFHSAWKASGIASYYDTTTRGSTAYGYHGVELPHYLVLMVRDAERMGGADGKAFWDMVSACLDSAAAPESGLQPMNGDETWLLAAPVRELDALLDNSWLLIASAEYGAELAARVGDAKRAASYRALASRARNAVSRFLTRDGWFAIGYGADGSRDLSLCPEVLARAAILGILPAADPRVSSGLAAAWSRLGFARGIRTDARSATISGGTPGYVLWAAAEEEPTFAPELVKRSLDFASATGCVWEYHDLYDRAWGGEKSRLWDSAVLLTGLTRALFTKQVVGGRPRFAVRPAVVEPMKVTPAPFDGEALLKSAGKSLILQQSSPQHAARIARELTRQRSALFAIAAYPGQPPAKDSAIIVSRTRPPAGWRQVGDYWVRDWSGPPQLWVQNRGHAYLDTDLVVNDLVSCLAPMREKPAPFPDASFELAARFGEAPAGQAQVTARSLFRRAEGRVALSGGQLELSAGSARIACRTRVQQAGLLELTVTASPRQTQLEAEVTFPPGWWLVYARDMEGRWDRVRDPVDEIRLPDGRIRLEYTFRPSDRPFSLTFRLARLRLP